MNILQMLVPIWHNLFEKMIQYHLKNISKETIENMFAETVTEYEILTEIDNLSTNKCTGHDNISAKMIKTIKQEICKLLPIFSI